MEHRRPRFNDSIAVMWTAAFLVMFGFEAVWGQTSGSSESGEWENALIPVSPSDSKHDELAKIKRGEPTSVEPLGPKVAFEWGYEFFVDPKLAADRRVMYSYDLNDMEAADIDAILTQAREANGNLLVAYIARFPEPVSLSKMSGEKKDVTFVAVPIKLNQQFGDALRAMKELYTEDAVKARNEMVQFATEVFKAAGLEDINKQISDGTATIYLAVGTHFRGRTEPAFKGVAAGSDWPTSDE